MLCAAVRVVIIPHLNRAPIIARCAAAVGAQCILGAIRRSAFIALGLGAFWFGSELS
jgi:hypothetical protein